MKKPKSLREIVALDLKRAQRLVSKIDDEIDPQFRIATAEGDYWIAITLAKDPAMRLEQLARVAKFMAWKLSPAFTLATELYEPDAVYCVGIAHKERFAALSRIIRNPLSFAPIEWLPAESIDPVITNLLPSGQTALDEGAIAELEAWFGATGRFPTVLLSR